MESNAATSARKVQVVHAQGRLDATRAPQLDEELAHAEARHSHIVLDCARVTYISSTCLRVLLIHARGLRRRGGDLKLCCVEAKVKQVLGTSGLDHVLNVLPDIESATGAFQADSGTTTNTKYSRALPA